jgi:predicted NUDIX family NTP pyrophosphohydrolase
MNLTVKIKKKYTSNRAGLLMYRTSNGKLEVLLALPGKPDKLDSGTWEIPKGKVEVGEDIFEGAVREFQEETGIKVDADFFGYLGSAAHNSTNTIHVWTFEGQWSPADGHTSNTFFEEWPPGSGKKKEFMEVIEIKWFDIDDAKNKIIPKQSVFLQRLKDKQNSLIVISEDEPYQRAVKKKHSKMKMRLIGLGGNKKKEKGHAKPSFKRSKSAPPGAGGT